MFAFSDDIVTLCTSPVFLLESNPVFRIKIIYQPLQNSFEFSYWNFSDLFQFSFLSSLSIIKIVWNLKSLFGINEIEIKHLSWACQSVTLSSNKNIGQLDVAYIKILKYVISMRNQVGSWGGLGRGNSQQLRVLAGFPKNLSSVPQKLC